MNIAGFGGITNKQRMQLLEEQIWINPRDEWLDIESESESDESDEETTATTTTKDEENFEKDPLYYGGADDKDAKWVEKYLAAHMGERRSDAILNCVCCFSLLSVDCQRHATYINQYRAMFVRNCRVAKDKEIRYRKEPDQLSKKQQKKRAWQERKQQQKILKEQKKNQHSQHQYYPEGFETIAQNSGEEQNNAHSTIINGQTTENMAVDSNNNDTYPNHTISTTETTTPHSNNQTQNQTAVDTRPFEFVDKILVEDEHLYDSEVFYPVHCAVCETEIGVMDSDEIYHFYNVIPSEF